MQIRIFYAILSKNIFVNLTTPHPSQNWWEFLNISFPYRSWSFVQFLEKKNNLGEIDPPPDHYSNEGGGWQTFSCADLDILRNSSKVFFGEETNPSPPISRMDGGLANMMLCTTLDISLNSQQKYFVNRSLDPPFR